MHRQFYPPEATVEVRPLAAAEPVRFTLWPTFEGGVGAYVPCAACVERAKRLSPREGVCRSSVRSFAQPERLKPCWERNGATPAKLDSFLVELLRPHFNPMEVLLAAAFLRDELLERVYPGLFTEEEFSARPG